jgi:uncharacterized membrane protein HdeD (DUF308 family)
MNMIETIRENAKTAKWVGVLLIIAGIVALFAPFAAGLSLAMLIGLLLAFGGISQILLAFRAGAFGAGLLVFALGALSAVAGVYMLARPGVALASLTLFLAAYFIVAGIAEAIGAFGARPTPGWGWLLFGGVVSVLLGIMIWGQFPLSGAWAVGVLTGVRLLMSGMELTAIGSAVGGATEA